MEEKLKSVGKLLKEIYPDSKIHIVVNRDKDLGELDVIDSWLLVGAEPQFTIKEESAHRQDNITNFKIYGVDHTIIKN